jgi:predicted phosphodiesterase
MMQCSTALGPLNVFIAAFTSAFSLVLSCQRKHRYATKNHEILIFLIFVCTLSVLQVTISFHIQSFPSNQKFANRKWYQRRQYFPFNRYLRGPTQQFLKIGDDNIPPTTFHKDIGANEMHLPNVDRVLVLSDLHTDHAENLAWLANRTARGDLSETDLLVVAGDISHDWERLGESFALLLETGASVLFVAGNHEAWLSSAQLNKADATASTSSVNKLERVYQLCRRMGVLTGCTVVGGTQSRTFPLYIFPLDSWYDGSLAIDECHDLIEDFPKWPWVDFIRCRWPFPGLDDLLLYKIPSGLVGFFAEHNHRVIQQFQDVWNPSNLFSENKRKQTGIMTVSHFLPNQQCLPDWKDITSNEFLRDLWLDHGGGGVSAKFALVAGTKKLDQQIRAVRQILFSDDGIFRHIHVFGHSHRPKDFELDDIRYIHNPLGKPREREICMVNPNVDFQIVWDTRKGEVEGEALIRYWEEKGGGVEMLRSRMKKSKRRSRYVFSQKGKTRRQVQKPSQESSGLHSTGGNVTISTSRNGNKNSRS